MDTQFAEKVASGFKAVGERFDDVEAKIGQLAKANEQLFSKSRTLDRLRLLGEVARTGVTPDGRPYTRFWPSDEHAEYFGEIILAALGKKSLDSYAHRDLGEAVPSGGGVLVPDELRMPWIDALGRYGKFRGNTTIVPMTSGSATVPKLRTDLPIYCPGEGKAATKGDVTFSQVKLIPKTWIALTAVSNELDEDAMIGVGEIVGRSTARSMAKQEDLVGFVGDGTEAYFGMTGIVGALRAVDATIGNIAGLKVGTGNAYSELTLGDFRGVVELLPEDVDDDAAWFMSKKFYYSVVYPLAEAAGIANMFDILSDRKGRYLYGYPVVFTSAMPSTAANSQICALLGDLRTAAYLAERKALTIEASRDVYFGNYQTGIRAVERIDVNVFNVGDTTNPGAVVGLITAAA